MSFLRNKKVSVVIPNYNYAKYLKKRVRSVLSQTYPIYELIILDDGSSDESVKVIQLEIGRIKTRYPNLKLRFEKNKRNSGKAMAQWKRGFELATGDYVWIAEADDFSSKYFLEKVMKGFDDADVVLSYAESLIVDSHGLILAPNFRWSRDKERTGHYKKSYIKDGKKEIEEIMAIRCTIPNVSAVVFRRDKVNMKYLEESMGFDQVGDWYFYSKILSNGKISYIHEPLNRFRIHKTSKTAKSKKSQAHWNEIRRLHDFFNLNYDLSDKTKEVMRLEEDRIRKKYDKN